MPKDPLKIKSKPEKKEHELIVSSSPHVRDTESVSKIMWTVSLALLPATLGSVYFFGLAALNLVPFKLPAVGSGTRAQRSGLLGAAVFGLVVGGSATACTACCNPLLAVPLGVAALQGHTLWGAGILAAFAIGFSLPLTGMLLGFSLGRSALKAKKAATVARIVGGLLLVGVGFYFLGTI